MHDVAMNPPLEEIRTDKGNRHDSPLPPQDAVQIGATDVDDCQANRVYDQDMKPTIVPSSNAVTVRGAILELAGAHRMLRQFHF